jgi:transcriptional regulator with XRE-family HTH domain
VAENDQLRAARERTASPAHPGEGLSRQELAQLVNAYIWDTHDKRVEVDANYIGKLERGGIRWPSQLYREALRAVLNVSTDAALGFVNPRRTVVQRPVDRKQFLRGAAFLGAGAMSLPPIVALLEGSEPTPVPPKVSARDVEQIHTAARVFATWDHTYGGGLAREAVQAQLRWSAGLLESTVPEKLRAPLLSAVGYLAHTTGFMAFDAYAHDDAQRIFRYALTCAEEAGDWHLRAKILSSMARQAIWIGRPDDGLTLAEFALVRADRLSATERAMLHVAHARALAKMGRVGDTLTAVGAADDEFARRNPASDAPWMAYYDAAQHAGDSGHALFDLAVIGRSREEARSRLAAAVAGHGPAYARSRAIAQTKLASLTMLAGDPVEAATIGREAVETAGTLRSRRAADDLRELGRYAGRHPKVAEVVELRHRISRTVIAS